MNERMSNRILLFEIVFSNFTQQLMELNYLYSVDKMFIHGKLYFNVFSIELIDLMMHTMQSFQQRVSFKCQKAIKCTAKHHRISEITRPDTK